jgi:hypothetical protein
MLVNKKSLKLFHLNLCMKLTNDESGRAHASITVELLHHSKQGAAASVCIWKRLQMQTA